MKKVWLFIGLAVIGILVSTQSHAQEFRPLNEVFQNTAKPYPFVRCAGLHRAIAEWSGKERLGDDVWARTEELVKTMLFAGVISSQETGMGGSLEHLYEIVVRDSLNVAEIYAARLVSNYAASGQAFGEDDLIKSDLQFCRQLAERL